MTLLPDDKGTTLVFLLVLAGALLLHRAATRDDARLATPGTVLAVAGVAAATLPGKSGEEGVPVLLAVLGAVIAAVGLWRHGTSAVLGTVATAAAVVLVGIAPGNTSAFLAGGPLHAGEREFVVAGMAALTAVAGYAALLARHDRARLAGVLIVYVLTALGHSTVVLSRLG